MTATAGPGGSRLVVETARDTPLVWFTIAARGGAAGDPAGREGMARHMAELARRGAGGRSRADIDEALDALGASIDVSTRRDSVLFSGLALARNLDAAIDLMADILARPTMDGREHDKLIRETLHGLDDVRDDDSLVATRYFDRYCVPGHPYARTARGTEASLAALDVEEVRRAYRRAAVPENLVVGFAGDIDDRRATALAERLMADVANAPAAPLPDVNCAAAPHGRRLVVVDKPARTQSQIVIGHLGPRWGTDDAVALTVVETVFGGTFTSRLMQEIRVKRGWSYGAGCRLLRARGPYWFRIDLAPAAEVTADALALTMSLYEQLAETGVSAAELAFAKSYLAGSLPFVLATARQRLHVAVSEEVLGLVPGHVHVEAEAIAATDLETTRAAGSRWLRPRDTCTVVVATADALLPSLEGQDFGAIEVVPFDAY